jgi:ABC-2 type transport system permease protein
MILGLIKILATLFLVAGIALVFYSFNLFSLGFYLLLFFGLLLWFAWIAGLFITGLIVNLGMKIQAFAWSLVGLLNPLSCVFYPLSSLPSALQKVAICLPTTHVFEGVRQVLAGSGGVGAHLVFAFLLNIFYSVLAILFFGAMFEKAREKGRLAKFEE